MSKRSLAPDSGGVPLAPQKEGLGSLPGRFEKQTLGRAATPAGPGPATPAAAGPAAAEGEAATAAEAGSAGPATTAARRAAAEAADASAPEDAAAAQCAAAADADTPRPKRPKLAFVPVFDINTWKADNDMPTDAAPVMASTVQQQPDGAAAQPPQQLDVSGGASRDEGPLSESVLKRQKFAMYEKHCSKVAEGLYVSGEAVAKSLQLLRENGITHIVNCNGKLYPEYFKPDGIMYKTFWLNDSPSEDILCVLYDAFEFIDAARAAGGRVLVHCSQGVSRSTTIAIAYLMWQMSQPYEDVYNAVRALRAICAPNFGFVQQLREWQERRGTPPARVWIYRLASHCADSPLYIVPKAVSPPKGAAFADWRALDPRGAFVVHVPGHLYVWRGSKCPDKLAEGADRAALRIHKYEGTPAPEPVRQGEEPEELVAALHPPSATEQLHGDMPTEPSNASPTGAGASGVDDLRSGPPGAGKAGNCPAATTGSCSAGAPAATACPIERAVAPEVAVAVDHQQLGWLGAVAEVDAYTEDYELFHRAFARTSAVAGESSALEPLHRADSPAGAKGRDQCKRRDRAF